MWVLFVCQWLTEKLCRRSASMNSASSARPQFAFSDCMSCSVCSASMHFLGVQISFHEQFSVSFGAFKSGGSHAAHCSLAHNTSLFTHSVLNRRHAAHAEVWWKVNNLMWTWWVYRRETHKRLHSSLEKITRASKILLPLYETRKVTIGYWPRVAFFYEERGEPRRVRVSGQSCSQTVPLITDHVSANHNRIAVSGPNLEGGEIATKGVDNRCSVGAFSLGIEKPLSMLLRVQS